MLAHLRTPRLKDQTPTEVHASLPGEGVYLCRVRTIYLDPCRPWRGCGTPHSSRRHPVYQKPELLAEGPNEVWSWDITKLMGPVKWSSFYLHVILDIDRRRVVGWRSEHAESAIQFKALFKDAMTKHAVPPDQLTLHAATTHFCGAPMKAKATALMLADPGVVKSPGQAAHIERQPVPGGPLQDAEISA